MLLRGKNAPRLGVQRSFALHLQPIAIPLGCCQILLQGGSSFQHQDRIFYLLVLQLQTLIYFAYVSR